MLKFLKWLVVLSITLAILLCLGSLFLSPTFQISRTENINSPQARVIHYIIRLSEWPKWWPWDQRGAELSMSGPSLEVGARFSWPSRPTPGHLVITKSTIYAIEFDIFLDGNKTPLKGSLLIKPLGESTEVTWTVAGAFETPVLAPYLALIVDDMHAGMLGWGLRNLKRDIENDKAPLEVIYDDEAGNPTSMPIPNN